MRHRLFRAIMIATAAGFGWHDFSHHDYVLGGITIGGCVMAFIIITLAVRKNKKGKK